MSEEEAGEGFIMGDHQCSLYVSHNHLSANAYDDEKFRPGVLVGLEPRNMRIFDVQGVCADTTWIQCT